MQLCLQFLVLRRFIAQGVLKAKQCWIKYFKYLSGGCTHLMRGAGARLANRFLKLSTRPKKFKLEKKALVDIYKVTKHIENLKPKVWTLALKVTQPDNLCYWYLDFCVDLLFHNQDIKQSDIAGALRLLSFMSLFLRNEFKFVWLSTRIIVPSTFRWQMTKVIKECAVT